MFVLGLTGSIAMGKSTVAAMFARCGALVQDADAVVHRLYCAGGAAVPAVAALVPEAVAGGRVDRAVLARFVLADEALLRALEAAVHPLVLAERRRFLRRARRRRAPLAVLEVPLLFEGGGERLVDAVCVVSAPAFVQARRLRARAGMTAAARAAIHRRQLPDARKRRLADVVVPTGLSRAVTWRRVAALARRLRRLRGRPWPPGRARALAAAAPRV